MLKCIEVSKEFGGLQALKKVDLTINENEITGLVGPNGSGKSTLLNVISGVYKPDSGRVLFMDEDISKLPPYAICSRGITKTAQTVQSFPDMTTIENVLAGVLFSKKESREQRDPTDRAKAASQVCRITRRKVQCLREKFERSGTEARSACKSPSNIAKAASPRRVVDRLNPERKRRSHRLDTTHQQAGSNHTHGGAHHESYHGSLRPRRCSSSWRENL